MFPLSSSFDIYDQGMASRVEVKLVMVIVSSTSSVEAV